MNPAARRFGSIPVVQRRSAVDTVWLVIDVAISVTAGVARAGERVGGAITRPLRAAAQHAARGAARHAVRELAPVVAAEFLDQIDLTELIRTRVDLVGLARYVVVAIDLPEIIRESAGSPIPGAEQAIRIQSIETDQAIAAWADRVFRPGRHLSAQDEPPPP
ncbi:MAG: hypothetical protein ACRDRM_07850 [Pseudonocardiaceae bacterium]